MIVTVGKTIRINVRGSFGDLELVRTADGPGLVEIIQGDQRIKLQAGNTHELAELKKAIDRACIEDIEYRKRECE